MDLLFELPDNEEDIYGIKGKFPLYVPGEWPTWFTDGTTARIWCELDEDFSLETLSLISDFEHPVASFVYECGVDELVDKWNGMLDDRELYRALAVLGVVYRQPFLLEVSVDYYCSDTQDGREYDCNVDWRILEVKPLAPEEAANRLDEWLAR